VPSKNVLANHELDIHFRTEFLYTLCRWNCPLPIMYRKRAVSGYHFAVVSLGKRWEKK